MTSRDEFWMQRAIALAKQAEQAGEVPVGAVLVHEDEVWAEGYNCPIQLNDPTAHAEIVVLRRAAEKIQNYRLVNTTLYVTLEPCVMCAGAMVHARIQRLVYGAADPKAGAIVSQTAVLEHPFLNHRIICEGNILASACATLLSEFFKTKRLKEKETLS